MSDSPIDPRNPTATRSAPPRAAPPGVLAWLPWLAALAFALLAGFLGQLWLGSRSEIVALREQKALAEIDAQSLRQQMEAERILAARRLADASAASPAKEDLSRLTLLPLRAPGSGGASATLVLAPQGRAGLLTAHGLRPLRGHQQYQVWLLRHGQGPSVCVGTFSGQATDGEIRIPLVFRQPPGEADSFAVRIGDPDSPPTGGGTTLLTGP